MSYVQTLGGLQNLSPGPDIGFQFQANGQPWPSVAAAHDGTPEAYRAIGKCRFVDAGDGQGIVEYMYKGGIGFANLVRRYANLETPQAFLDAIQEKVDLAEQHAQDAQVAAETAGADYDQKGWYDPVSNVPALTADASLPAGPKPKEYIISGPGTLAFATEGNAAGYAVEKNDRLRELSDGKWLVYRDMNTQRLGTLEVDMGKVVGRVTVLDERIILRNLANPANFVTGSARDSDGSVVANAGFARTGKIKVTPGVTYAGRGAGSMLMRYGCYFNLALSGPVAGGWSATSRSTFTPPPGAEWVEVTIDINDVSSFQLEVGDTPTTYVPFGKLLGKDFRLLAADVTTEPGKQFSSQTEKDSWNAGGVLAGRYFTKNLANPANFFVGRIMQANGIPVLAAGFTTTGQIPVTPGQTYSMNTSNDTGFLYGCWFNSLGGAVPGTGWFEVNTKIATAPGGAATFMGTFRDAEKVQFELAPAPTAIVPYGNLTSSTVSPDPAVMAFDVERQTVTKAEKGVITNLTPLSGKVGYKNLANPAQFVTGQVMQSNGTAVANAAYSYSGKIPVVAGQVYACNTSANTGCLYGTFYAANGTSIVASTGWGPVDRLFFTAPSGASFFVGTFPAANASTFQVELGGSPTPYIAYGSPQLNGVGMLAGDVLTIPTKQFSSQTEKDSWNAGGGLAGRYFTKNLANPASFTLGRIMQANGIPVTAAGFNTTGLIRVTGGLVYSMNTSEDVGFLYGCWFNSSVGAIAGTGWFEVNTKVATAPGTAFFFMGTFRAAYGDKVQFELAPAPTAIVPYGNLTSSTVSPDPAVMAFDVERQTVTKVEKARLANLTFLDSKFGDFEARGILQRKTMLPSPIAGDLTLLGDYLRNAQTDEDLVLETYGESTATGIPGQGQYSSPSVNSHLLFEFCRQENFYTKRTRYIWETWFPAQKQARFDTPGFFTETGSGTQTNDARYWGHQWANPGTGEDFGGPSDNNQIYMDRYYRILTNNGSNASVSFNLPASYYKAALMMSYSHLATAQLRAVVTGGNGQLEYETSTPGVYAELNGHDFNTSTPDEFKAAIFQNSTKIRKDQFSMPIKMRRQDGKILTDDIQVTFTAVDGKQIEYWGLYYTRARRLFIPVCSAMGSHTGEKLTPFFEFGLLKRNPNFILYYVDLINNWRASPTNATDTPTMYGTRIADFAASLLAHTSVDGLLATFGMWHQGMNVFDANGVSVAYKSDEGYNTALDYIRRAIALVKGLKSVPGNAGRVAVSDATPPLLSYIRNLAADKGISLRDATGKNYPADPPNTDSLLMDMIHPSNMCAEVMYRFDMNNWHFA